MNINDTGFSEASDQTLKGEPKLFKCGGPVARTRNRHMGSPDRSPSTLYHNNHYRLEEILEDIVFKSCETISPWRNN